MFIETRITIKKAKLKDSKLSVEFEEAVEGGTLKHSISFSFNVHPDLQAVYHNLSEHGARIAGQVEPKEIWMEHAKYYNCSGVSISGDGDEEGLVLTMQRTLPSGLTLCYNTPYIILGEPEIYDPRLMNMLQNDLDVWRQEVKSVICQGKQADDPQGDLFKQ